jgi:dedicator of cytokinesis protein 3
MEEPQQVFIGIFPASHIHMRDELSDAEGRLADVANSLHLNPRAIEIVNGDSHAADVNPVLHDSHHWNKEKVSPHMTPVLEEEEDSPMIRKSIRPMMPPGLSTPSRTALAIYPPSVRSSSPDSQVLKPLPPRPSLKSGDDTVSGGRQPIVDEIASALREWHTLMFQYLARRDYRLFHIVREHIEALHLGRRQLLAQTLSEDETTNLRRDCVTRLVSGNIVQGLDIIARHPTWGGLVTVDVEGEIDPRSWVSAVRMYSMQVSLAYLDVSYSPSSDAKPNSISLAPVADYGSSPHPTPAHSAFPEYPRPKARPVGSLGSPYSTKSTAAKFYHVVIDLRAFVASPCVPGETAELFFSLYNKSEQRFVSEEFCAVLNHNGVLARDPTAKIRTLFTDLAHTDVQDPIYLVARIVRNGALKMGSSLGSVVAGNDSARRVSEASPRGDSPATSSFVEGTVPSPTGPTSPTSVRGSAQSDNSNQIRRPFGCAVLQLADLTRMANGQAEVSSTREYTMPIFIPVNETLFSMLHQDIINSNTKEYEKSSRYGIFFFFPPFRSGA